MDKTQLGVIFGSRSCEHDVSIISAIQLMNAADANKYDVIPVYISRQGAWYTGAPLRRLDSYKPFSEDAPGVKRVELDLTSGSGALTRFVEGRGLLGRPKREMVARLDCVIPVLHGLNGEDGAISGVLEMANIPYAASGITGSALGMDKISMKRFLRGAGFPVLPDTFALRSEWESRPDEIIKRCEDALEYPMFVKPSCLGSSIGVSRAATRDELKDALDLAFSYDRRVLVEKGLDHPLEVNCSVLGFDGDIAASPLEMPVTGGDLLSFFEKYLAGASSQKGMAALKRVIPAPIGDDMTHALQDMSKQIFLQMDLKGVVRIDYMISTQNDTAYITEVNTIPGSMAYYLWTPEGKTFPQLIDQLVDIARNAHEQKNANNYAFESDILKNSSLGKKGGKMGLKS